MNTLEQSYTILDKLRLENGLYIASPSNFYSYVWIRDSCYEVMCYLDKDCGRYEQTYQRLLDLFLHYEWKIDIAIKQKPTYTFEYFHSRFHADTITEITNQEWGHNQIDAVSLFLWGIAEGIKKGKKIIRNNKDIVILQKIVHYLNSIEYWHCQDNSLWEEQTELHSSSIGAAVGALKHIKGIVEVPDWMIEKGEKALENLLPFESITKPVDLSQLTLIFPFNVLPYNKVKEVLSRVEKYLVRERGVIRYQSDSYFSTLEEKYGRDKPSTFYLGEEAEWTMGFGFLALAFNTIGNIDKAKYYLHKLESVMDENGNFPELYYSKTDIPNENNPLGWSQSLYIIAKEQIR
jgi:phosphorylase kinase alpha/beta subunit